MIINCQNCNTKYLVADESIGINGRNVKCVKCDNVWFEKCQIEERYQNSKTSSILDDSSTAKNTEFNNNHVPVVIKNKSHILYISLIIILLLISASTILIYSDKMKDIIPNFIDQKLGNTFEIKNINFNSKEDQKIISFSIINNSNKPEKIKQIIISFSNDEKKIIKSYSIDCNTEIKAQAEYQVNQLLDNYVKKTDFLIIDITS